MMDGAGLLGRWLAEAGVERVYGAVALPPLRRVPVADAGAASLLADADGRLGPGPGAALLADGVLRLSSRPGTVMAPVAVTSGRELAEALAPALAVAAGVLPGTAALRLDFDLDAPAPSGLRLPSPAVAGAPAELPALPEVERVIVHAGPGVLRAGAVPGLRALAGAGHLGVANSWGAKGVFDWRSPHHLGTVGLQERDFALAGFADTDLIVGAGVDPDETPRERWALTAVVDVGVDALEALTGRWPAAPRPTIAQPELFRRLAEVVQPLYGTPGTPGHAVADLAARLGERDRVVADPGPAGLWVARAFPTTRVGSVVVPATVAPGFAAAAALAGALRRPPQRVVAVTTAPLDAATRAVLALAESLGVVLEVEAWGEEVDLSWTASLVEVAGPVVAWGGLAGLAPNPPTGGAPGRPAPPRPRP